MNIILSKMKSISYWAKDHPKLAIFLITIGHMLMVIYAHALGILTYLLDYSFPEPLVNILIVFIILAYLTYPKRSSAKTNPHFYIKRKGYDMGFIAMYSMLIVVAFNIDISGSSEPVFITLPAPIEAVVHPVVNLPESSIPLFKPIKKLRKEIRQYKKQLRKQLRKVKSQQVKKKSLTKFQKIIRLSLTILLGLILTGLIGLIVCGLSCSSNVVVAVVAGVLGVWFIGLYVVYVIMPIINAPLRSPPKKKEQEEQKVKLHPLNKEDIPTSYD